jgi:hypothetical protein
MTTTEIDYEKLAELQAEFDALRQEIIARDGEIQIGTSYPELDAISRRMFYILSGGTYRIRISAEQIQAMATN